MLITIPFIGIVKAASAIYKDRRFELSVQAFCFDEDDNKNLHEIVRHYSSCIDNTIIGNHS
jgi:hypothetical protein